VKRNEKKSPPKIKEKESPPKIRLEILSDKETRPSQCFVKPGLAISLIEVSTYLDWIQNCPPK
jgi:hypothetical protein